MANQANIKAVITAEDRASAVLRNFGSAADNLGGKIAAGFKLAAEATAAAGVAVAGFGALSVKAYTDSQNVQAQLNAVLKSTHSIAGLTIQDLNDQSKALQKLTKYDDEAIGSAQALLLTFTDLKGPVVKQATETVLDMSTALGQDLKSSSIQLGKALQDPINGITALRRVGVNFNDKQKEVITNLVETGQKAKAQQVILKELNTEFGGSAKAAGDTFSGSLAKLKNSFNDIQESIGQTIVKYLVPLISKVAEFVSSIDWDKAIKRAIGALKGLWGAMTGDGATSGGTMGKLELIIAKFRITVIEIGKMADKALKFLLPSLKALWKTIETQLVPSFKRLLPYVDDIAKIFGIYLVGSIWLLVNILNIVIKAVSDLVQWFFDVKKAIGDFVNEVSKAFHKITDVISQVWTKVKNDTVAAWQDIYNTAIHPVLEVIGGAINIIGHVIEYVWGWVNALTMVAWHWMYDNAVKPVLDWISAAAKVVGDFIVAVWQRVSDWAGVAFGVIKRIASDIWGWITGIWGGAVNWFSRIWDGIADGAKGPANSIRSVFSSVFEDIKNIARSSVNWVIDRVNGMIGGINSVADKVPGAPKLGKIPHLYKGARNFSGGLAVVGDINGQGGELVSLPQGSNVYTNKESKSMLAGAGSVNININVGALMGTDVEARKFAQIMFSHLQDAMYSKMRTA